MALKNSKQLFQQAQQVLIAGVDSPVRSFQSVGGNPLAMKRGIGSKFYDVDNNAYTDYCLSWGALILGHSHKGVMAAIKKQLAAGTSFGTTTKPEIEIARFICKHIPSIERIRFVNSGTEATMSAVRLARGFTQKDMVVKFDNCYHGHFDDFLIKAGSGVVRLKESSSGGIAKSHIQNTLSLPYDNTAVLAKTLERHKHKIACVIIEPVAGNSGVRVPSMDFLKTLRRLTKKYNIVLIFDEIMTGFRTNLGGVQSDFGIIPDMTCLGKIIGGGFPVGAYGGKKEIMNHLAPLGSVYQAGTFSGNPVVMAAGLSTLKNLNASFYKRLNSLAENFTAEINHYFYANGVKANMIGYKGMMSIDLPKRTIYPRLFQHLLKNGIYWPPAEFESFFISGAHTRKDLDKLFNVIKGFLTE